MSAHNRSDMTPGGTPNERCFRVTNRSPHLHFEIHSGSMWVLGEAPGLADLLGTGPQALPQGADVRC
jgi:hypothetical protein